MSRAALFACALVAACQKPAPSVPTAIEPPLNPYARPGEPSVGTAAAERLPLDRWMELNPGNHMWVLHMTPAQTFRVSARWDDPSHDVRLELWAIDMENDAEWDEAHGVQNFGIDAGADGVVSGVLRLVPKSNAGRIRLTRRGDGMGHLGLKIEQIEAPPVGDAGLGVPIGPRDEQKLQR